MPLLHAARLLLSKTLPNPYLDQSQSGREPKQARQMDGKGRRADGRCNLAEGASRGVEPRLGVEGALGAWLGDKGRARVRRVVTSLESSFLGGWQAPSRLERTELRRASVSSEALEMHTFV